ncbi:MAG: ATP-binding protein [Brevinematia bacterium]
MSKTSIFLIPTSNTLKKLNCWLTTTSSFHTNFCESKNSLIFSGKTKFEVDLSSSSIRIDLNAGIFSFIVVSKGKVIFGERKRDVTFVSDFERVILIEDFKLSNEFRKKFYSISDVTDSQKLLEDLRKLVGDRGITIIFRKNFYFFHEVCFLPAKGNNVDNYLSLLLSKMTDFSEDDIWKTKTVLYEVFDNAIEHGSKFDENKMIKVETLISNNGLHIIVSDQGEGFDISGINFSLNPEKPTGRGLTMIKMLSDIFAVEDKGKTTNIFIARSNSLYIPYIF